MRRRPITAALLAVTLLATACSDDEPDAATTTTSAPTTQTTEAEPEVAHAGYAGHEPEQYAGTSNWICHPDLADDECTDLSTTVIAPDGTREVVEAQRAPADETDFDCFYVYPTTSADPTPVADLDVDSGCVISFAAYAADSPPAEGSLFGRVRDTGEPALCVDPLALTGDDDPLGDAVVVTSGGLLGAPTSGLEDVTTPFATVVDAVRTRCAEADGYRYLAIERPADDPRPLDALVEQRLGPTWGLHLLDANLVQGDLIELVERQARAHAAG